MHAGPELSRQPQSVERRMALFGEGTLGELPCRDGGLIPASRALLKEPAPITRLPRPRPKSPYKSVPHTDRHNISCLADATRSLKASAFYIEVTSSATPSNLKYYLTSELLACISCDALTNLEHSVSIADLSCNRCPDHPKSVHIIQSLRATGCVF
jgi:hypothetical protein